MIIIIDTFHSNTTAEGMMANFTSFFLLSTITKFSISVFFWKFTQMLSCILSFATVPNGNAKIMFAIDSWKQAFSKKLEIIKL